MSASYKSEPYRLATIRPGIKYALHSGGTLRGAPRPPAQHSPVTMKDKKHPAAPSRIINRLRRAFRRLYENEAGYSRHVERDVEHQRVALAFEQAPTGNAVSALIAVLLVAVLWPAGRPAALVIWLVVAALVIGSHYSLIEQYRASAPQSDTIHLWRRRFIAASGVSGALWGVAGALLFPAESLPHQLFMAFVVGGMAAGAVPYMAAVWPAYVAFLAGADLPLAVRLLAAGDPVHRVMGLLVLLFGLLMLLTSHHLCRVITQSLNLRFHKRALSRSLMHMSEQLSAEITCRERAERTASELECRSRVLAEAPFEGIIVHDGGAIIDANRALLEQFGLPIEDILGRRITEFVAPAFRAEVEREIRQRSGRVFEITGQCPDGRTIDLEVRGRDLSVAGRMVRVISTRDRGAGDARLRARPDYDPLTGLANRSRFRELFGQTIHRARRLNTFAGLLCMDVDGFKVINEGLGHGVGDRLLQQVAERLRVSMRGEDSLARFGADEFAVILDRLTGPEDAFAIAQRILASMQEKFVVDGHELFSGACIGIAVFPLDGSTPEELLCDAEAALSRAKERGRNQCEFFTREINVQTHQRFHLENGLRRALDRGEFVLHYQPKVEMRSGAVIGVEALIRWQHPDRGMISPLEFIHVAEKNGLIVPIGEWVLETACAMARRWHDAARPELPVAVNLSLRQLRQKDIVQRIAGALARSGLPRRRIELEITEGALAEDIEYASALLHALHELDVPLAIDDFGIGYSSLSHLRRFPVSYLKVDRSFIRNVPDDRGDAVIVSTVSAMAESLGLRMIAEGVETPEQVAFLTGKGCYAAQGHLIGHPLPEAELFTWHDEWSRTVQQHGCHPLFAPSGPQRFN
jgi:diguanylate cyclase (GGDEF)-like protein/PAS domain S-box-containing protein